MPVVKAFVQDPFSPKLLSSEVLAVSDEQKMYIKKVLDKACSDSRFADKAYIAIVYILMGGKTVVPEVTSLNPGSATVGDPDVTLHVMGTGFTAGSKIIFNGGEEVTTYVSATELTTLVSMATVTGASVVPVGVMSEDGLLSNTQNFVFQDASAPLAAMAATPAPAATKTATAMKK